MTLPSPASSAVRVSDRLAGVLIFLPVPVVLWLFTRQPLGPWASLGLGVLLVLTHRLYARPFALSRAGRRCLWCGGPAGEGPGVDVDEPFGRTSWRACGAAHARVLTRTLGWAAERSRRLAFGILGTLALFLFLSVAAALGRPAWLEAADATAVFRLGIALTVLPLGWLAPESRPAHPRGLAPESRPAHPRGLAPESRPAHPRGLAPESRTSGARGLALESQPASRLPFPVHIQALLGTLWVVWLFRLVGLWWLVAGLLHLARRLA